MKKLLFIVLFFAVVCGLHAQVIMFRPDAAAGFYSSGDTNGFSYSYGGKVILMANNFQRYGVLIKHLVFDDGSSYLSTGIYLEQVLFKYFNMGIGTAGYIGLSGNGNPFGLYTHLGFEYPFAKRFHFLTAYNSEFIFARNLIVNNAFMLGAGVSF